jgi:hypothetical protein
MIPLSAYLHMKGKYCVAYFGDDPDALLRLKRLRPHAQRRFPGVEIWIACPDRHRYVLEGEDGIIPTSELRPDLFACVRVLGGDDPVGEWERESGLDAGHDH